MFLFTFGGLPSETYRYKLTLSVDTPEGVKTGSNVVELNYFSVHFPAQGAMHDLRGQALYLDLGSGRRPLIALLTHIRRDDEVAQNGHLYRYRWSGDSPSTVLADTCLSDAEKLDWMEMAKRLKEHCHRPAPILPGDLPDLVTFADVKDPKSVIVVDPFHLTATLGAGVAWRSLTLEVTDEPLTRGIDEHLPWVREYNPNIWIPDLHSFNGLHDFVNARDFVRGCCGLLTRPES
jgi:hypothetical protein